MYDKSAWTKQVKQHGWVRVPWVKGHARFEHPQFPGHTLFVTAGTCAWNHVARVSPYRTPKHGMNLDSLLAHLNRFHKNPGAFGRPASAK